MRWPIALRSTVDALRIRLVGKHQECDELRDHCAALTVELRKRRLLIASLTENTETRKAS